MATQKKVVTARDYFQNLNTLSQKQREKYLRIYAYGLSDGGWFRATDLVTKKDKKTGEIIKKGILQVGYNTRKRVGKDLKNMVSMGFLTPEKSPEPRLYKANPEVLYSFAKDYSYTEKEFITVKTLINEVVESNIFQWSGGGVSFLRLIFSIFAPPGCFSDVGIYVKYTPLLSISKRLYYDLCFRKSVKEFGIGWTFSPGGFSVEPEHQEIPIYANLIDASLRGKIIQEIIFEIINSCSSKKEIDKQLREVENYVVKTPTHWIRKYFNDNTQFFINRLKANVHSAIKIQDKKRKWRKVSSSQQQEH